MEKQKAAIFEASELESLVTLDQLPNDRGLTDVSIPHGEAMLSEDVP